MVFLLGNPLLAKLRVPSRAGAAPIVQVEQLIGSNKIAGTSALNPQPDAAQPPNQRIAERAYYLWEHAGRPAGRDNEFWLEAVEQEKLRVCGILLRLEPAAVDLVHTEKPEVTVLGRADGKTNLAVRARHGVPGSSHPFFV
jgi:hypothetical protein